MLTIQDQLQETATQLFSKEFGQLSKNEMYITVATLTQNLAAKEIENTSVLTKKQDAKQLYYFSMEFLMGRLLINNLQNMNIFDEIDEVLKPYGVSIKDIEFEEGDAGLGNGGLGRLAACFMDSIASLNYPGHGITLRYRHGFFKQTFVDNKQVELPDLWLNNRNVWENKISDDATTVSFYGNLHKAEDGSYSLTDTVDVLAMPYDMPIVGASQTANRLRMYDVLPLENQKNFDTYEKDIMDIVSCLYPDDSTTKGKELRLKQQYLFVSAGLQNILKEHLATHQTLDNLADHVVMQINDTHPTLLIPELMCVLVDQHGYNFKDAFALTSKCIAYTNHTILAEALETWDAKMLQKLLPRVYQMIEDINDMFLESLKPYNYTKEQVEKMAIIAKKKVHMANLAIVGSFSVNGVAALHTKILVEKEMKIWADHYPTKFNNKTNGITQRRWFHYANPDLSSLVKSHSDDRLMEKPIEWFKAFEQQLDNEVVLQQLMDIKAANKTKLSSYIQKHEGISINQNAILDIQIKRLHAYKRQLLNVFHIIYLYQRLLNDETFKENFHPQTFIFGAKAAPSYVLAKNTIQLIRTMADIINADERVADKLQVIMVTNYNVSYAEKLIPAADISEQISTAGFEASGTGNMKFMMNGALTLGTMDGANVEIHELVGDDNIEIFGLLKDDVFAIHASDYKVKDDIKDDETITFILDYIKKLKDFQPILDYFEKENDYYLVVKDFKAYVKAQEHLNALYKDQQAWTKKALINIARSGYFSSDRTIEDYVNDIWKLEKLVD
ncbi:MULTISPECIES: glycogen/starch/alpha-glucan family phosphorylase [unclassified Breznakia]|uniref:glycogen/starch/alpha-glucan family phosphorylase n=1 Tax=unclassified Breznakia TaxID=2623764 RepID=UPI0024770EB0|nr:MULTISPECIES: glycogen/starch/alpha-glucan family phosphorylase [unclassified Breznakia]MDH6367322.1 starch phosphorylase [Breznakia sp. PH1-1]MDH6404530.1 starch phosphorylase [Breznakia sp. PF1-11]MDH6412239.1 starch phosphorylase [Breznakia sp. PFB1-11]MDH6414489.1 starch phosphorylase [Breznakia sp. PFB1-14]MDH6416903.1 starch phosphorylase [Breznakia sp. PFB1-4]